MAEILIAALAPTGHVGPMLTIAEDLVARGDRVTIMTAPQHHDAVATIGATAHTLAPGAEMDDTEWDSAARRQTSGSSGLNKAIIRIFLRPMARQLAELDAVLAQRRFDAIIADVHFLGVVALLLRDRINRPSVLVYTPSPLALSSRDTAPFGMALPPGRGRLGLLRNRMLNLYSHKVMLRPSQRTANLILREVGAQPLPVFLLDAGVLADRYIVPTVPEFEYPRSDLPAHVRFVGAVHPRSQHGFRQPSWWSELDGDRPVVHVTQGTIDNTDLDRLITPTIAALADENVIVVVSTGRKAPDLHGPLPANTYVAEYIPHDALLPKVDVMVTNGGYGAVQRAVCAGVPLVVAGSTEDKPEVAARVQWSGAGINLRTGTPTASDIRAAVRKVLTDHRYLHRVRELESAFAQRDGVAEIGVLIDEVLAERNKSVAR